MSSKSSVCLTLTEHVRTTTFQVLNSHMWRWLPYWEVQVQTKELQAPLCWKLPYRWRKDKDA